MKEPARSALELLESTRGDSIRDVTYREIAYESRKPEFVCSDRHSVDYGVELHLGSGAVVSVIWDVPSDTGLKVLPSDLSSELRPETARWPVSGTAPWPDIIGKHIASTALRWYPSERSDHWYPCGIRLSLVGHEPVFLALGEYSDEATLVSDDAVTVFFSEANAERFGCAFSQSGPAT